MILAYDNYVDYSATTIVASSNVTTLPVSNLQDRRLAKVYRSTTPGNYTVDFDFGVSRTFQVLLIAGALLDSADTVQWQGSTVSAGAGDVFDTGAVASNIKAGNWLSLQYFSTAQTARYVRLTVAATSRVSAGFADIGRVMIAPIVPNLDRNPDWGLVDTWVDGSSCERGTRSGVRFVDVAFKLRTVQIAFTNLNQTLARTLQDLDYAAGMSTQVFACLDPTTASEWSREGIFGYISTMSGMQYAAYQSFQKGYVIEQAL